MAMYANLSEDAVKKVADLEADLDVCLLAYTDYATLTQEDLDQVKELESKLNVSLIAYK